MKAKRFLMMLLSLVALTAAGAEDKYLHEFSGNCGDQGTNVQFHWDPTTRTMTFSGSGRMADFPENWKPWNNESGAPSATSYIDYVVVGERITYIGKNAFNHYYRLYGVSIGPYVTEIGEDAFAHTPNLSFIRLEGTNLPRLGHYNVFYGAPKHRKFLVNHDFVVPQNGNWVLHYHPGSYEEDTGREVNYMVEIDGTCGDHLWYQIDSENNKLSIMGWGAMANYTEDDRAPWDVSGSGKANAKNLSIEGRETNIGDYAFRNFEITTLTIPNTVERIGQHAFHACSNLASITFPNQLKTIGNSAFYNCDALTAITLPNSLTTIEADAFDSCDALKSVVFGSGLTSIAAGAFKSCTAMDDIYCYADPDPTKLTWTTNSNDFKSGKGTKCHVASDVRDTWATTFSTVNVTFEGDLGTTLTGEGTVNNPYLLWSAADLVMISDKFHSANAEEVNKVKGKYFLQCANLEFNKNTANNYTPIALFDGDYDGNGYLISGLNVNVTGDAALFLNMAAGSKVYNVIIKNSSFQGSMAAAVACELGNTASIENCHVLKDVTVRSNNYYAGGLVAHMSANSPTIVDCTSHAQVTADQSYASGVVGAVTHGSVKGCAYLGIGNNINSQSGSHAVCQNNSGTVEGCYYTALAFTNEDANAQLRPLNNADNSDFLEMMMERDDFLKTNSGLTNSDICYNLTLNGRTLFKEDEGWNTLCLPFDVSDFTGTPLARAIVKTLASSTYSNYVGEGELTLNFTENSLTSIEAGKPYLVKWNKTYTDILGEHNEDDAENPEFTDVTVGAVNGSTIPTFFVDFVGTLSAVDLKANDSSKLYLGDGNKLYYPSKDMTIGSCRAFFELDGLTASDSSAGARTFVLNFGDGESTRISATQNDKGEMINDKWYTIDGRLLNGTPTQRGIYINNGKKVVIK